MQLPHRRYKYKKLREKVVRSIQEVNEVMGLLTPTRRLRAASAVLILVCTCVTIHLVANQSNNNTFYQTEIGFTNIIITSSTYSNNIKVQETIEPTAVIRREQNQTVVKKDGYLVWNPNCWIDEMDPFNKSIKQFLRPAAKIECSRLAPLTYTTRVADHLILRVDKAVVTQYLTNTSHLQCCLSVITRVSENKNKVSRCKEFKYEVQLGAREEFLLVQCHNKKNKKRVYTNVHAVVQVKAATTSPLDNGSAPAVAPKRLNVLLLGIDSMSRLNMLRTMPRTVAHLRKNDWVELRGYNKIGDNTLPNLLAVLTGLNAEQLKTRGCWPSKTFDKCTFIWKEFKKKGYVTAYAEDEPYMGTFNYRKEGFKIPPTDYYFRPFMIEAYARVPLQRRDYLTVCLGPTSTTEHFLRFVTDLATTPQTSPFFALIWLNNFSHNNHNTPAAMDSQFEHFFQNLLASGALNTTLVVFFSDHGTRFGKIRTTYMGWKEERLPFINFWIPKWFRTNYPHYYNNIQENGNQLTSPYDLHLTLKHIVTGLEEVGSVNNGSAGCPSCVSLFTPISQNRECKDVSIAPHWCTCGTQATIPHNDITVKKATQYAVNEIEGRLRRAGNITNKCAKLKLDKILSARIKIDGNHSQSLYNDYIIAFSTSPGQAHFDATVRHWFKHEVPKFELGFISRINYYGTNAFCVKNYVLKLYCHCVP